MLQHQSPYYVLYNKSLMYDHLIVFGCCCFLYLRPFNSYKLEYRSPPCTFLGYSPSHKGYQCLTPDEKVIISRHVVFDERRLLYSEEVCREPNTKPVATYVPLIRQAPVSGAECRPSNSDNIVSAPDPPVRTGNDKWILQL